jgi:flagellar hook assembly protein FlgD
VSASAAAQGTSSIRVFPNPATGPLTLRLQIVGGQPQSVRVRLYDANGRWIADLADGTFGAGETQLTWNRQTRGGGQAGPGYYEALGTIGSTRVRERLVLLP